MVFDGYGFISLSTFALQLYSPGGFILSAAEISAIWNLPMRFAA